MTGEILFLGDGVYKVRGPYQAGETVSLGETAVLDIAGRVKVLLHSKPGFTHDPNAFESQGLEVAGQDFIVVNSDYHFTLNFEGLGSPLLVATPGVSYYTPGGIPRHIGRFWPEHELTDDAIMAPETFRSAAFS